mmetsp:Transcript_25329/g.84611  ORF Transcript_25329/g.84611 Transcript_25329/m.84611 type:complete len:245 (+) Transcript_25329:786-1520(+)
MIAEVAPVLPTHKAQQVQDAVGALLHHCLDILLHPHGRVIEWTEGFLDVLAEVEAFLTHTRLVAIHELSCVRLNPCRETHDVLRRDAVHFRLQDRQPQFVDLPRQARHRILNAAQRGYGAAGSLVHLEVVRSSEESTSASTADQPPQLLGLGARPGVGPLGEHARERQLRHLGVSHLHAIPIEGAPRTLQRQFISSAARMPCDRREDNNHLRCSRNSHHVELQPDKARPFPRMKRPADKRCPTN